MQSSSRQSAMAVRSGGHPINATTIWAMYPIVPPHCAGLSHLSAAGDGRLHGDTDAIG